jgi:hypothetical protein
MFVRAPQMSVCHEVQVVFRPTVAAPSRSNHYEAAVELRDDGDST